MSFEWIPRWTAILAIPFFLALALLASIALVLVTLPPVEKLNTCLTTSMNHIELCPKKSNYVRLSQISPYLIDSIIASEDGAFYSHNGFDWFEIKESIETNWKEGRMARGGSTLTQQLVKNVFLDKEKSLLRKLREAILTIQVEKKFSKKEILEKYLNVVELGPDIYGVKAASKYYFGKSPDQINILEAAYLAFLLPNPKLHHIYFAKKKLTQYASQRILEICIRLFRFKKISQEDLQIAHFKLLEFPWKNIIWERTELMNTVDGMLEEETGQKPETILPQIDENLPDSDPELENSPHSNWENTPSTDKDQESPWDEGGENEDESY